MRFATLISWLITAGLGAFMLDTWLVRGGLRRARETPGGLPPQLIFGHAAAAVAGLLLWAAYLLAGERPLAWAAVGALMVAVGLGLSTVTLWTPYPTRKPGKPPAAAGRGGAAAPLPGTAAAAEGAAERGDPDAFQVTDAMIAGLLDDPFPRARNAGAPLRPIHPNPAVLVPIAHGFAAIATFVLAVMTATG
ncbi:MAG: hypothetical protein ABSA02_17205 [Trebonia sp.]|jgi:hypothetical protein